MPATTQVSKGEVVGLAYGQIFLVGSDGYAYGTAGEGAIAGTTTHALLMQFLKTAQLPSPARVIAALTGGNRWLGQVMFGPNDLGAFPITASDLDSNAMALLGASAVDLATNSRWRRFSPNSDLANLPQVGLILSTIYQSRDDDSDGLNLFVNYVIPRAQIDVNMPGMNYQAPGDVTYQVSPTFATREPNGRLFSAGAMGLKRNRTWGYAIVAPKPLALTTHIGDAIATTIKLGYLPTSTIITLNAAANEWAKNGVLTALTSVDLVTALATKPAGASMDKEVIFYETDFAAAPP